MLEKGKISSIQYTLTLILFLLGITGFMPKTPAAGPDSWLLYLLASLWGMLLLYTYSALLKSFPSKTILQIFPEVFGSILGKALSLLYISYFLLLTSLILRVVSDFLTIILPRTPIVVLATTYILLAVFVVRIGVEVIGRLSEFVTPIVAFIQLTTVFFALPDMDFESLQPVLGNGITPLLKGAIGTAGFPFGEVVLFLMIMPFLNTKSKVNKASLVGMLIVAFSYFIFSIQVNTILGPLVEFVTYPRFRTVSYIQISSSLERGESFFILAFLMAAFIKLAVCFYASCLGLAQVFNLKDYRFSVTPLALLATSLSIIVFENETEIFPFISLVYPLHVLTLSFAIPLVTLVASKFINKIKHKH